MTPHVGVLVAGVPPMIATVGVLALVLLAVVGLGVARHQRGEAEDELAKLLDEDDDSVVDLEAPLVRKPKFGMLGELVRTYRYLHKRRKLLADGYVQWYLIDDSFPRPKFVKPESEGGGIPELDHDGKTYLFPREAMLASESQGFWTVVHTKGDASPLNLNDPSAFAIPPDAVKEYLQMSISREPPSWLSSLNLEPEDMVKYGIGALIVIAILQGIMGGGF